MAEHITLAATSCTEQDLTKFWANALETCLQQGCLLPLYCMTVAGNGTILVAQFDDNAAGDLTPNFLYSREVEGSYALPITMLWTDTHGHAAKFSIVPPDAPAGEPGH